MTRSLLWASLPDQRPRRELYWMSRMPQTQVTALAAQEPVGQVHWVPATYRRPIKRFVEAGALAWMRELRSQDPAAYDWAASLELCSLVTGQLASWARRGQGTGASIKRAVITWENLPDQILYKVPLYRRAFNSSRDADLLLCMVDAARDHLLANGFEQERIAVVKPGVDTELFSPSDHPSEEPIVLFASPLAENKGIDTVLRAMSIVRTSIPEARLVVAGQGRLHSLVAEAAEDRSSGVTLAGSLASAGVAQLMRSAAVFATAPRPTFKWTEQLGLAYLEAQACGLPVVTTLCGTNAEALAPGNVLIETGPHESANKGASGDTVEAMAAAIVQFLSKPSERSSQGQANREYISTFHELNAQCAAMGEAFAAAERR